MEREREIYELLVRVVFFHRGSHTRTALMQMHSATTLDWPMELVVAPLQVVKGKPLYVGLAERKEAGKRILQLKHFCMCVFVTLPENKMGGKWYVWSREQVTFKLVFDYPKYQEAWFGLVDWTVLFFQTSTWEAQLHCPDPIYWIVMQAVIHPFHPSIIQSHHIIKPTQQLPNIVSNLTFLHFYPPWRLDKRDFGSDSHSPVTVDMVAMEVSPAAGGCWWWIDSKSRKTSMLQEKWQGSHRWT